MWIYYQTKLRSSQPTCNKTYLLTLVAVKESSVFITRPSKKHEWSMLKRPELSDGFQERILSTGWWRWLWGYVDILLMRSSGVNIINCLVPTGLGSKLTYSTYRGSGIINIAQGYCGTSRSLWGDRTQSLWPWQELPDTYHPTHLIVMSIPPLWATWPTPFYSLLAKIMQPTPHPSIGAVYTHTGPRTRDFPGNFPLTLPHANELSFPRPIRRLNMSHTDTK